jgi:hypothetical protein
MLAQGGVLFIGEGLGIIRKNSSTESIYKLLLQSSIFVRIRQKGINSVLVEIYFDSMEFLAPTP